MSSDKIYLGNNQSPLSDDGEVFNRQRSYYFTCPGCYADLSPSLGIETCDSCGAVVEKTHEEPEEPDSKTRMVRVSDGDGPGAES
jgi:rRNA maturation endonuclease Nob1